MPLLVLMVGVVTNLTGLLRISDVRGKKLWTQGLFYSGIVLPIVMQFVQFANVPTQKAREREAALALYAFAQYTQNPTQTSGSRDRYLLELASKRDPSIDPNFFLGYALFRAKEYKDAERRFLSAQKEGRFLAPSEYLIATIERMDAENSSRPDYSKAAKDMRKAIDDDKDYMASYYGMAILDLKTNQYDNAWNDLEKSTTNMAEACYAINDENEVKNLWEPLVDMNSDRFEKLKECIKKFGPEDPGETATAQ